MDIFGKGNTHLLFCRSAFTIGKVYPLNCGKPVQNHPSSRKGSSKTTKDLPEKLLFSIPLLWKWGYANMP